MEERRRLIFNPTAEEAIRQNNVNYQPSKILAQFEKDVALLMPFVDTSLDDRREDTVVWSDSPTIDWQIYGKRERWDDQKRLFHSRLTSVEVEKALSKRELPHWMTVEYLPKVISNSAEFDESYKVCKSLWSSSGRGVMIDKDGKESEARRRFVKKLIETDGYAIQEIFMQRLVELAFLFYIGKDGEVIYIGRNHYKSAENGAFGVEMIGTDPMEEYVRVLGDKWESSVCSQFFIVLKEVLADKGYRGYVGIDSMLYVGKDGNPHLRSCVEVNLRMTMGNINLGIRKMFPEGVEAEWSIVVKNKVEIPKQSLKEALEERKDSFLIAEGEVFAAIGRFL